MKLFSIGKLVVSVSDEILSLDKRFANLIDPFSDELPTADVFSLHFCIDEGLILPQPQINVGEECFYSDGNLLYFWFTDDLNSFAVWNLSTDSMLLYCTSCRIHGLTFPLFRIMFSSFLANHSGFFMHGAVVDHNGSGVIFTAPSGTGKSTHSDFWAERFGDEIINGDKALVRMIDGVPMVFGSPWSGSSNICKNKGVPLKAIVRIVQAPFNRMTKCDPAEALGHMASGVYYPYWNDELTDRTMETMDAVLEQVPVWTLECLPEAESAVVARDALFPET